MGMVFCGVGPSGDTVTEQTFGDFSWEEQWFNLEPVLLSTREGLTSALRRWQVQLHNVWGLRLHNAK